MADDPRTYSETEHYALLNDAVTRETAAAQGKITELETANTALGTQVDTLETEKAQAIADAEAARTELAEYKATAEAEKAQEAKREERLRQVAEANPVLDLTSTEGEAGEAVKTRTERIVAMSDEVFEGYLADMRQVAGQAAPAGGGQPPRQSAAFQPTPPAPGEKKGTVAGLRAAGRALTTTKAGA